MQLISSVIISLIVEGAKRIQAIPVTPEQTGRIRIIGIVLSTIATLIMAYTQGALATSNTLPIIGTTLVTYLLSVLSYHGLLKTVPPDAA